MRAVIGTGAAAVALTAAAVVAWVDVLDNQRGATGVPAAAATAYEPPAVKVAPGVNIDPAEVSAVVDEAVNDPRGWRTNLGHITVRIVPAGTEGTGPMPGLIGTAHFDRQLVAISDEAWTVLGPRLAAVGGTLDDQRRWILLHEIGHLLAEDGDHADCPGPGQPAPVMRATSYDLGGCALNVWPHP